VVVSVADTGEGFSKETQEKLFEPLFTTKVRGIGLGLAISKTLVEAHGGTIEAASIPGEGSTFTVILPTEVVEK
jgi:signal transduction histidine kinase